VSYSLTPPIIWPHGSIGGFLYFSDIVDVWGGAFEPGIDARNGEAHGYSPYMGLNVFPYQIVFELHGASIPMEISEVKNFFA
jgi:hypothetical protein